MKRNSTTAFLALLLASVLLAGAFGYAAKQYRQNLTDFAELPSEFDSATLQEVEAHLQRRLADALAWANTIAALQAAIERQDSDRITEIQDQLISRLGETAESIRGLTLEQATRDAAQAEQLLQTFNEKSRILNRYIGVSLGSLALALTLIAWRVARSYNGIGFKVVLAAISGLLAWFYFWKSPDWGAGLPPPLDLLPDYGLPGMFFVAGVLFPYLVQTNLARPRALGLIVVATISFWSAIKVAVHFGRPLPVPMLEIDMRAYLLASLVGAAIMLTGACILVPLKRKLELALAGTVAAMVGGLLFEPTEAWPFLAFMLWHSLIAIAIHISENWQWRTSKVE